MEEDRDESGPKGRPKKGGGVGGNLNFWSPEGGGWHGKNCRATTLLDGISRRKVLLTPGVSVVRR